MLDAETIVADAGADHKSELRLWLRLLALTTMIEREIRRRLRRDFGVTLPRFDLMAQLARGEAGLSLGEVSRRMMVSNGNVTGLVERLSADGIIERFADPNDRRAQIIRLTAAGRAAFARMAEAHESWIAELLAEVPPGDIDQVMILLGRAKSAAAAAILKGDAA